MGGIPTAVSETMVRNHFSQWGQVTELAFSVQQMMHLVADSCCYARAYLAHAAAMQPAAAHAMSHAVHLLSHLLCCNRWWIATFPKIGL